MSESKFYHFSAAGLFYGIETLEEAIAAIEGRRICLVQFLSAFKGRAHFSDQIQSAFIHYLLKTALMIEQVPKIEHFTNNTFIIFNSFSYAEK